MMSAAVQSKREKRRSRHWQRAMLLLFLSAILVSTSLLVGGSALAATIGNPDETLQPAYMLEPVAARVAAGLLHSAMINYDGQLLMWGDNSYGQLGLPDLDYSDTPVAVSLPGKAAEVSLGAYHTLVVLTNGTVYAFGRNAFGQLGDGTTTNSSVPIRVPELVNIVAVAAGAYHSLALSADGSVWAWGNNTDGQVGDVFSESIEDAGGKLLGYRCTKPVRIVAGRAVAIAAGGQHSLYLDYTGLVFAWGDNSLGQLGDGTNQSHAKPVQVSGLSSVSSISAGYQHNLALCRQAGHDALMTWGDDSLGQLGIGSNPADQVTRTLPARVDMTGDDDPANDHIISIKAGYAQSAAITPALKEDGATDVNRQRLLVWGSNSNGQLSAGQQDVLNRPVAVGGCYNGWTGDSFMPFDGIALGGFHSLVLSSKGILGAAGRGDFGQLGNLSVLNRHELVIVDIPDLIRPAWPETSRISINYDDSMDLVVRWPAAQDNLAVAGYLVRVERSDGQVMEQDAGNSLVQVFSLVNPKWGYAVTVMAYDENSRSASSKTFSSLTSYILPADARQDNDPAAYFNNWQPSVPRRDFTANHWQLEPSGLLQPLEMPWDVTRIYGPSAITPPASWLAFDIVAAISGVLLILVIVAIGIRSRYRHRLIRHISHVSLPNSQSTV